MSKDALPEKMRDIDFWDGTDNASWLMKLKKRIQYHFVIGPRDGSARELPLTVLSLIGAGALRYENTDGTDTLGVYGDRFNLWQAQRYYYVSRIQPWSRWGIVLQWPLFLNCWFIYRRKDVISPLRYKSEFGIKKMFTFHIGYKRDSDRVYWPTAFIGGNFE